MDVSTYVNMGISLLAVLNPFGVAAIYISMIGGRDPKELARISIQFTIGIIVIMLISIWLGHIFLTAFGINLPSFECAGGIILALIGLGMILPKPAPQQTDPNTHQNMGAAKKPQIAIVPLAIPLAAGPGVIAMAIADAERLHGSLMDKGIFCIIAVFVCLIMGLVIFFAPTIGKRLGNTAMETISRVMGLIITAIGLNMLANGMLALFPGLH